MSNNGIRVLAGLAAVVVILVIIAVAVGLFQGSFAQTVPVTVLSPRAGLVIGMQLYFPQGDPIPATALVVLSLIHI